MRALGFLPTALACVSILTADPPVYSSAGLVNSADNQSGWLAPNTIATLYGKFLAYNTATLSSTEISGGLLPTVLPSTGVRILVNNLPGNPYYVSPTQINFLVPPNLLPGPATVQLVIDGLAGPPISITLSSAAPALFQLDQQTIVATRPDGSLISSDAPANSGDVVVLYATGLGQTIPPIGENEMPSAAAPIQMLSEFQVVVDGHPVGPSAILYAGIAPGFAGLYQINFVLPALAAANPEIRLAIGNNVSISGLHIPAGGSPTNVTFGRLNQ